MATATRSRTGSKGASPSLISKLATPKMLRVLGAVLAASLIFFVIWSWRPSAKPPSDTEGVRAWVLQQLGQAFAKDPVEEGEVPNHVDAIEFRNVTAGEKPPLVYEFDGTILGQGKDGHAEVGTVHGLYDMNRQKLDANISIGLNVRRLEVTFGN